MDVSVAAAGQLSLPTLVSIASRLIQYILVLGKFFTVIQHSSVLILIEYSVDVSGNPDPGGHDCINVNVW
jgi:hypothetical protein